jgi:type II secretory ATPase GspE/PulE/Tfp pilus assembly ATPase PilB-like protein
MQKHEIKQYKEQDKSVYKANGVEHCDGQSYVGRKLTKERAHMKVQA